MAREVLPAHRWYRCDGCGLPQLIARLSPKDEADGKRKCRMTQVNQSALAPHCDGRMRGPIDNPFPHLTTLDENHFAEYDARMAVARKRRNAAVKKAEKEALA